MLDRQHSELAKIADLLGREIAWLSTQIAKIHDSVPRREISDPVDRLAFGGCHGCFKLIRVGVALIRAAIRDQHTAPVILVLERPVIEWYVRVVWLRRYATKETREAFVAAQSEETDHQNYPRLRDLLKLTDLEDKDLQENVLSRIRFLNDQVHGGPFIFAANHPDQSKHGLRLDARLLDWFRVFGKTAFLVTKQMLEIARIDAPQLEEIVERKRSFDRKIGDWGSSTSRIDQSPP